MGQTLTHGVYLPDEGERNCYSGLAANWQILDTSVGTIAANTAALAGKAPLVHTHTKSDITDFPAYGTTAGTICEGNDSRLSDARTPVAHTHTKADVTDLLNSNFIPSANNTYDLGSSSNQWNNLYAKNYYYNGTAWGLDKSNNWSGNNTFSGTTSFTAANININSSNFSLGDTVSSNQVKRFQWYDASSNRYACIAVNYATDKSVWVDIPLRTKNTEGTGFVDKGIRFQVKPDNTSALLPVNNSATDLGTSTNKWKTLNGINPGALSLPDYSRTMDIDTTNWSKSGNMIVYTPTFDGWLQITIPNDNDGEGVKSNMISILDSGASPLTGFSVSNILGPRLYFLYPVRASRVYWLYVKSYSETITVARLIKCMGNV